MGAFNYVWHGGEWQSNFEKKLVNKLERAAITVENNTKQLLGTKYPPASQPLQPPHLRSGELRRSITHTVDPKKLTARVGTNKVYARYLQKGTGVMQPRDFLEKGLQDSREQIKDILGK